MVSRHAALYFLLLPLVLLAGCGLFTVSPFPGFVDKTDISIDLGSRIDAITSGASPVNYDLNIVDQAGLSPRVLLLVEPPSSDPTLGFNYKGKLIFMDQDLNVLGEAATPSSLDYFAKPYAYAHDGNILAGYIVLNPVGGTTSIGSLNPAPPLGGFAFTKPTGPGAPFTYVFATPAGQYASFDLTFVGYNNSTWTIGVPQGTLAIIPQSARPDPSSPNYVNLGYQLVGLAYDSSTDEITFVFSEPAQGRILGARIGLAAATSGSGVLLPAVTGWPVGADAWPVALNQDRPELHADAGGIFMVQRDGWMTRYAWTSPDQPLAWLGSSTQIIGDRSLSRRYAFLVPQTPGLPQYMYRFDPSSRILTRYKRWW
ncbi:MAG: hypothetical protein ABSG38_05885 [Spirochaetia bacterium]|jgi:hypothetical protein